jgi:hypothetical protein
MVCGLICHSPCKGNIFGNLSPWYKCSTSFFSLVSALNVPEMAYMQVLLDLLATYGGSVAAGCRNC